MSTTPAQLQTIEDLAPDLLVLRMNAPERTTADIPAALKAKAQANGAYFLITDLTNVKSLGKGVGDRAPDMVRAEWFRGVIYVSASPAVKLVLKVFNLGLFLSGQADFPSEYVKTMDEALAAVDRMRAAAAKPG